MSGWEFDGVEVEFTEEAIFELPGGGSFLPLPESLAKKKAIINVRNSDDECLKWAIKSALFPPQDGKNAERPSKYSGKKDGINWSGINFPTRVKEIDKLEKQNPWLAINVFGWENDRAVVYRISKKAGDARLINLMLIEDEDLERQHYCWIKRETALFFDAEKNNRRFYCMMCLTHFTKQILLEEHKKHCNGVNGAPTRIEMPKEGENKVRFVNFQKQMKAPSIIYADFEAILKKEETSEAKSENESWTKKLERHEACGYAYIVVRSDGQATAAKSYRGEKAAENFLKSIVEEEKKIREALAAPKAIEMEQEDWIRFRRAVNCHVCEKSLIKEEFLDSLPIWDKEGVGEDGKEKLKYWGQGHKSCFYKAQNEKKYWEKRKKEEGEKWQKKTRKQQKSGKKDRNKY